MVRIGHAPWHTGDAGMTTLTLRDLAPDGPYILDHHQLMLVTKGHGTHEVDFVAYPCRPGVLFWARPGQVVRFGGQVGLDAVLVCWSPDLDTPPDGPTHWLPAGEDEDAVINEVSQLVVDCERRLSAVLLRQQLAVLLLRIALLGTSNPDSRAAAEGEAETFRRFRAHIEQEYARTRRVDDYAAHLGCCVRTLTRASLAATGRSAKQVIDDRVALQAKRLLAGTDLPVAEIGRRLGFPEPTNFGRYFQREVGQSPGSFRQGLADQPLAVVPAPRQPLDTIHSRIQA
ncbi:helix-turn-helix domain-containing protein [Phytohabitans rumicis]|uniref:Transcriptional regulator n=1 Tax=Phytohabitans rumicis TaxID=1076125 RepID=A0A6V8L349_9ACTN|nr:AraC family transcriptional regulator [Phytohabitans rumicis]GFJ88556.1 transcriptional regulator [Phytohabitans rumicis]